MLENPYESSKALRDAAPSPERSSSSRGVAIVLLVLSIPAGLIAFGVVCTGTFVASDLMGLGNTQNEVFFGAGAIAGGLAVAAMIWAAKILAAKRMRKRVGKKK